VCVYEFLLASFTHTMILILVHVVSLNHLFLFIAIAVLSCGSATICLVTHLWLDFFFFPFDTGV
jgi:hypothetical protein